VTVRNGCDALNASNLSPSQHTRYGSDAIFHIENVPHVDQHVHLNGPGRISTERRYTIKIIESGIKKNSEKSGRFIPRNTMRRTRSMWKKRCASIQNYHDTMLSGSDSGENDMISGIPYHTMVSSSRPLLFDHLLDTVLVAHDSPRSLSRGRN